MKKLIILSLFFLTITSCNSQNNKESEKIKEESKLEIVEHNKLPKAKTEFESKLLFISKAKLNLEYSEFHFRQYEIVEKRNLYWSVRTKENKTYLFYTQVKNFKGIDTNENDVDMVSFSEDSVLANLIQRYHQHLKERKSNK